MKKVRVLTLGTGGMATTHAEAYAGIDDAEVVAGVDVNADALRTFCDRFDIETRFDSLEDALDWGEFDAVSNVTPDALHHRTTLPLLHAGKHVLCEKPLATNYQDAREMAEAAAKVGVVNMVNLSYRNVAAVQKAAEIVAQGKIGSIRHFEASYLQSWLTQPAWGDWQSESKWLWRLSTQHGSKGVLGDVGIHILDFTCFVAGSLPRDISCRLKTFHKADGDQIGEYPLDANDSCAMDLELENGAVGVVSATRFASGHHNDLRLRIYGDLGGVEAAYEKATGRVRLCTGADLETETWRDVETPDVRSTYQRFIEAIVGKSSGVPDFKTAADLQKALDGAEQSDRQDGRRVTLV